MLITLPLKLKPTAFKLPPVMLPVALINPPVRIFPPVILPVTVALVNVPTDVMFGCALVVTVAAVVADVAVPDDTAYVALATVPVMLAPVIDVSAEPLPMK